MEVVMVAAWLFFTLDKNYQIDVIGTYPSKSACEAAAIEWRKPRELEKLTYHCMIQKPKTKQ